MGDQAPKIVVTNWLKNVPVSKDLSGKFIVIDFWATWCSPCLESVPHMNDLAEKNKQKTNLIFLAMTDERADKVKRLLLRLPFSSSVVADTTRKTSDNFKIESIPYCVVIDDQNIVRWLGYPTELTSADIEEILERKTITAPVAEKTTTAIDSVTSKMYKKLFENYYASFNDKSLKEYFAMGPVIRQKHGSSFSSGPSANNAFDDVAIGCALISRLADYLDVAEKQLILPDSLTEMYISYCYKSKKKNTKKQLMDNILNSLGLKYTVRDSTMDVMQLEVADRALLTKVLSDSKKNEVSHSSSSESYAAIGNGFFKGLENEISQKFKIVVVLKPDSIFDKPMDLTIRTDNMQNVIVSLKDYGIKTTMIKKPFPVYLFERKKQSFDSH